MILPTSFWQYSGSLRWFLSSHVSHLVQALSHVTGDSSHWSSHCHLLTQFIRHGGGDGGDGGWICTTKDGGEGGGNGKSNGVEAVETPTSLAAVATKSREKRSFIVPAHGQEEEDTCGSQATCDARGWACVMPECVDRVVARR